MGLWKAEQAFVMTYKALNEKACNLFAGWAAAICSQ